MASLHLLWSLVVLTKDPVPGTASCSSCPHTLAWGWALQELLLGASNTHSCTSCPLTCSSARAGVFGDQFFQDARRCQVLPLTPTPWPVGAVLGGSPDAPPPRGSL